MQDIFINHQPGVVVGDMIPLPEECIETTVVGQIARMTVAQVPLTNLKNGCIL